MKKYFNDCRTEEQVKARFTELAKKFHPDNGGDAEQFKAMMNEYKEAFKQYKGIHEDSKGQTYTKETAYSAEDFAEIIEKIIHFEGVKIEIIGSWIWVSGNTYNYREALKENKFFFSKSKKAWYNNGADKKSFRKGHFTLEQLRERWGTEEVETKKTDKIESAAAAQ